MIRADLALSKRYPEKSRRQWGHLIDEGLVTLGGRHLRKSTLVAPDAPFEFPADNPSLEWRLVFPGVSIPILCNDGLILAANKSAGLPSHPNSRHETDSVAHRLVEVLPASATSREGFLLNRLDVGTSGVILSATSSEAAAELPPLFRRGSTLSLAKEYLALVWGHPQFEVLDVDLPIAPVSRRGRGVVALPPGAAQRHRGSAQEAHTRLEVLARGTYAGRPAALLRARLDHGMTHQVRVHLLSTGHSLVGDEIYKVPGFPPLSPAPQALGLHCSRVSIGACGHFPKGLDITAPTPPEFDSFRKTE